MIKAQHGQALRELINRSATHDKQQKTKIAKILRDLDAIALHRDVLIAQEGMKGYKA